MVIAGLPDEIIAACQRQGLIGKNGWQARLLAGDGSSRNFYRLHRQTAGPPGPDRLSFIIATPSSGADFAGLDKGMAEALSTYLIGNHLFAREVPVPEILGFDKQTGILFFEDLGDTLLHDRIRAGLPAAELLDLYKQAVAVLVFMQFAGRQDFNPEWCWDTPRYDRKLMLDRESLYFLHAFCRDFLGMEATDAGLQEEFLLLAERAGRQPADFFLHRDFQSRNLMIHNDVIRIIDFQGGRLGPLAYDLAALLIDPYAGLPRDLQDELLGHYLSLIAARGINRQDFLDGYFSLALQRNLQILGAFAFLSRVKGKMFFRPYIRPALATLNEHLAKAEAADYPLLRKLAADCLRLVKT